MILVCIFAAKARGRNRQVLKRRLNKNKANPPGVRKEYYIAYQAGMWQRIAQWLSLIFMMT